MAISLSTTERGLKMGDLNAKEVAKRLELDIFTVSRYCRQGFFPGAYKKNPYAQRRSEWRIPEEAVEAFERKRTETAVKGNTNN
jgi:predicted site-specific integrase-resolvase